SSCVELVDLTRRRERVDEVRRRQRVIHAILQLAGQRHLLTEQRVAQLQRDILAQRETEARAATNGAGLIGGELGGLLHLLRQIEAPRDPVAEQIGLYERKLIAVRMLAVLDGCLGVEAHAKQVTLADADLTHEAIRGGVAAGDRELAG